MRLLVVLAIALAVFQPVQAEECTLTTSSPEFDTGREGHDAVGQRYYWDNDPCQPCMWSTWVYQESNGIDGLQREDEVVDDTCHGMIEGDTIVF